MRNLMIFLFLPMIIRAEAGKNSNSLSPQTLLVECPANVTISEGQKYDTSVTGFPKVVMNDGGAVTISYIEIFQRVIAQTVMIWSPEYLLFAMP
ncbi:MAG: hypothetical protein U0T81_12555 [Saprospiraceae bacterium]